MTLENKPDFHDNVDSPCCKEGTLLHRAVHLGMSSRFSALNQSFSDIVDMVSALLANGANPCVQNDEGKTPYNLCKSDGVRNGFIQEILRAITISK